MTTSNTIPNSSPNSSAGGSLGRFYFVAWLALGAAGIFYVTIAALAPEVLRNADAGTGALEQTTKQVATLTDTVGQIRTVVAATQSKQQELASGMDVLRNEVSGIKVRLTDLKSVNQSVVERLSGLDGKGVPVVEAQPAKPVQSAAVKAAPTAAPPIEGAVIEDTGSAETPMSSEAALDEANGGAPLVIKAPAKKTAKVAAAAADAKPAAAPGKPYGIELAMSTSPDALKQIWQLFKEQHAGMLNGLSPRSVVSGSNVKLVAGPFPSQAAAAAQCAKLRKEGMSCSPAPLGGTPL